MRVARLEGIVFGWWVVFCAWCSLVGWGLSLGKALNAVGYAVGLGGGVVAAGIYLRGSVWARPQGMRWGRLRRRYRRIFPAAFLVLAGLAFLGGILHGPTNFDGLTYRVPRVLHWLAEGQWSWIYTDFGRLNSRGQAYEWVTAPMLSLMGTDRWLFVINAICFCFLPGRIFAILTRLGVNRRVAYLWMWLLPSAYGFALQAGSIGSDLFGVLAVMAAIEFALRARETGRVEYVWLSGIGAGLMTGSKAFNLLLLLPWAIAIAPSLRLLLRKPVGSVAAIVLAVSASMIPTAALNVKYCGDWTGLVAEPVDIGEGPKLLHFGVNIALITLHNFAPPIFPLSGAWARFMAGVVSDETEARMLQYFEPGAPRLHIGEMQIEEVAGLGMGLSLLLVWILVRQLRRRGGQQFSLAARLLRYEALIMAGGWIALGVFMVKSGLEAPGRYLTPFYILLIGPILVSRSALELVRNKLWRTAALAAVALAVILVIVNPARPLWPALTVLRKAGASAESGGLKGRAWRVYSVYRDRQDAFAEVRRSLPDDANPLGVVMRNDPETSLWKPFGIRRVLHLKEADTPDVTRRRGIEYILVSVHTVERVWKRTLPEWLQTNNAEVIKEFRLRLLARKGGESEWRLVKLRAAEGGK